MDDIKLEEKTVEENTELAVAEQPSAIANIWANDAAWKMAVQRVKVLAQSDLVPDNYKNKPANCMIAMDIANRKGMSPLMVMQNLYVVKGKPSWSGQYCINAVNSCGQFSRLEFVKILDDKGGIKGYMARATDLRTGKLCEGAPVTWDMVKGEGWLDKPGSKWKTMPDQMFQYRAAAFFVRTHCPEVLDGLYTKDEMNDVYGYDEKKEPVVINV